MSFLLALFLLASPAKAQDEGDGTMNTPGLIATGSYTVYYNVDAPLAMVTQVSRPKDSTYIGEVTGRSCQHGIYIPITLSLQPKTISGAGGDGGYRKIILQIKRDHPDLVGIYDVKVDMASMSILGIYRRLCTIITARGYK